MLGGQVVGRAVARAKGTEHDRERWVPTASERDLVLAPAGRILARHVRGDVATADAVDAALIAAGLGHFAVRAAYDIDAIPARKEPSAQ